MGWRVGIDSGGTFTDLCLFEEETGRIEVWKLSSTPDDPSRAIAEGVREAMVRLGGRVSDIAYLGHGTTVATNALIQHRGARTGLVTTRGFRDLLEIGRQKRPDLYDLQVEKPPVLVARDLRLEVPERLRHDGTVETALDEAAVREAAQALKQAGVEAVAVCFLYGFIAPAHEAAARRILAEELPEAFLTASHAVAPEFREYERLSTAVVNSYLGPVMQRYLRRLAERLVTLGLAVPPYLTQSNGGIIGLDAAAAMPVRMVLSGPSTGLVGAQAIGRLAGFPDLITFDMGGTSTDVALLPGGEPGLSAEAVVHGYPIKAPMLDIHTVGAGGGSIAYRDGGGLLKVGPRSAGASPGPACYGGGNSEPTVTDANVMLGLQHPTHLLGGRLAVRRELAVAAVERLAAGLGLAPMAAAEGILAVVTANMAKAIRVISVQRGHDPRDYTLMAFGGAGPLHAARLARELEIRRVLVPRSPGILCAMGLLLTDLRADFAATRIVPLDDGLAVMAEAFARLEAEAEAWFAVQQVPVAARKLHRRVDLRYAGQNHELPVDLPPGPIGPASAAALAEGFAAAHRRAYGFLIETEPVQLVTYRLEATGTVPKAALPARPPAGSAAGAARTGTREAWLPGEGGAIALPVYARDALAPGNRIEGPAIIEQMDSTTLVLPGMTATVDAFENILLEERG